MLRTGGAPARTSLRNANRRAASSSARPCIKSTQPTTSCESSRVRARPLHTVPTRHTAGLGLARTVLVAVAASWTIYIIQKDGRLLPAARADERITSHAELDQTPTHLDPDTKIEHPTGLRPEGLNGQDLRLAGLGVRVVSFLRVQVYSVGAYFSAKALDTVKISLEEQGEQAVARLLQAGDASIRIVPVKNTDFGHLRDGFVRAMMARLTVAQRAGLIANDDAEASACAIDTFKGFFPSGKVPRGKSLLLSRRASDGALIVQYEDRLLGTLNDKFLSRELMLAYFADNGREISPKMKADVLAGLRRRSGV